MQYVNMISIGNFPALYIILFWQVSCARQSTKCSTLRTEYVKAHAAQIESLNGACSPQVPPTSVAKVECNETQSHVIQEIAKL